MSNYIQKETIYIFKFNYSNPKFYKLDFLDTFLTPILLNSPGSDAQNETYEFSEKGIAWPSDKEKYGKTKYTIDQIRPPLDWAERYPNGTYTEQYPPPNIAEDERFQVWMRTAGLPDFRKLWGKNEGTMKMGQYQIEIRSCK